MNRLIVAGGLAALIMGLGWYVQHEGYTAGQQAIQAAWDADKAQAQAAAMDRHQQQTKVITKTVTKFVEQAAAERIVYRDIIKEVETYVPTSLAVLPGSFRVYHDAAATGERLPDTSDSARINAFTVSPQQVAITVAENYAACHYDQQRLEALQEIVRTIKQD